MKKETFILRSEWYDAIKELTQEQKGVLLDNLFKHHWDEYGEVNTEDFTVRLIWKIIHPCLIHNANAYDGRRETSAKNGALGGRPRTEDKEGDNLNNLTPEPNKPIETLIDIVTVIEPVIDIETEKETPAPKKAPVSKTLHGLIKEAFEAYYLEMVKKDYYWTAKDAGKASSIIAKLRFAINKAGSKTEGPAKTTVTLTEENQRVLRSFNRLLELITDEYILKNLSMSTIDSNYNQIIANANFKKIKERVAPSAQTSTKIEGKTPNVI